MSLYQQWNDSNSSKEARWTSTPIGNAPSGSGEDSRRMSKHHRTSILRGFVKEKAHSARHKVRKHYHGERRDNQDTSRTSQSSPGEHKSALGLVKVIKGVAGRGEEKQHIVEGDSRVLIDKIDKITKLEGDIASLNNIHRIEKEATGYMSSLDTSFRKPPNLLTDADEFEACQHRILFRRCLLPKPGYNGGQLTTLSHCIYSFWAEGDTNNFQRCWPYWEEALEAQKHILGVYDSVSSYLSIVGRSIEDLRGRAVQEGPSDSGELEKDVHETEEKIVKPLLAEIKVRLRAPEERLVAAYKVVRYIDIEAQRSQDPRY